MEGGALHNYARMSGMRQNYPGLSRAIMPLSLSSFLECLKNHPYILRSTHDSLDGNRWSVSILCKNYQITSEHRQAVHYFCYLQTF